MKTERCQAVRLVLVLAVATVLVPPVMSGGLSKGVPDAPPVEQILARHEGFVFPGGFETRDGRSLPAGIYDLLLVESSDRYYIQLVNRETRRGLRVAAEASGKLLREMTVPEPTVSLEPDDGHERFEFHVGEFTATVSLLRR